MEPLPDVRDAQCRSLRGCGPECQPARIRSFRQRPHPDARSNDDRAAPGRRRASRSLRAQRLWCAAGAGRDRRSSRHRRARHRLSLPLRRAISRWRILSAHCATTRPTPAYGYYGGVDRQWRNVVAASRSQPGYSHHGQNRARYRVAERSGPGAATTRTWGDVIYQIDSANLYLSYKFKLLDRGRGCNVANTFFAAAIVASISAVECAAEHEAGFERRRREIDPFRPACAWKKRLKRSTSQAITSAEVAHRRLLAEEQAEHAAHVIGRERHAARRAPPRCRPSISRVVFAPRLVMKARRADQPSSVARPAAIATGFPDSVPAWYTGRAARSAP